MISPGKKQGWVGTEISRDETRQDKDIVLKSFRDKTSRDTKTRQMHSRQSKTGWLCSRRDKTFKLLEI